MRDLNEARDEMRRAHDAGEWEAAAIAALEAGHASSEVASVVARTLQAQTYLTLASLDIAAAGAAPLPAERYSVVRCLCTGDAAWAILDTEQGLHAPFPTLGAEVQVKTMVGRLEHGALRHEQLEWHEVTS